MWCCAVVLCFILFCSFNWWCYRTTSEWIIHHHLKGSWLKKNIIHHVVSTQVRHAEDLGVNPTKASLLISYLSISSTAGRLFFGRVADSKCFNRLYVHQIGLFIIGLCSFLVPMATGYGGLVAYAVTFGFFEADFVVLIPLVTLDIVGAARMSYALGSSFTVMAFPLLVGPPLAGIITFNICVWRDRPCEGYL